MDNYRQFRWTSKLFSEDEMSSPVDIIKMHTEELTEEWNMDIETFIIMDARNENASQPAAVSAIRDFCEDYPLLVRDTETVDYEVEREGIKKQNELVFREINERRETRTRWTNVSKEFLVELAKRRRRNRLSKWKKRKPAAKKPLARADDDPLLASLEEFYGKFDLVIADLEDRQELIEIEEFKQLVIQDLCDRSDALLEFKRRLPFVIQELMQKVVIHDLKHEGLLPYAPKATKTLLCDEWIEVPDDESIAYETDWIVWDEF
jgi:hypothetical protein